jgi:hypothetical protein
MLKEEFDFLTMLRILVEHEVEFIVVGGMCAVLHGAPVQTFDLDIVQSRDPANLLKLEQALREMGAYYREHPPGRILPDATRMTTPGHHFLRTTAGPLDVLGAIAGQRDYAALLPHTVEIELDHNLWIRILDLETLIITKRETGRQKDKLVLPILLHTLEELHREE